MITQCPSCIIISTRGVLRVFLAFQEVNRQVPVRLVHFDNVRSRWKLPFFDFYAILCLMDFDSLLQKDIDQKCCIHRIFLLRRNDVGIRRLILSFFVGAQSPLPEIFQEMFFICSHKVKGFQVSGLLVIDIVPHRPENFFIRRQGPVPFPRGHTPPALAQVSLHRIPDRVSEGLVEADDPMMIPGNRTPVIRSPTCPERMGPDSWHSV
ncbi:hypothetical protein ES703_48049 [subsurface metagenome]